MPNGNSYPTMGGPMPPSNAGAIPPSPAGIMPPSTAGAMPPSLPSGFPAPPPGGYMPPSAGPVGGTQTPDISSLITVFYLVGFYVYTLAQVLNYLFGAVGASVVAVYYTTYTYTQEQWA